MAIEENGNVWNKKAKNNKKTIIYQKTQEVSKREVLEWYRPCFYSRKKVICTRLSRIFALSILKNSLKLHHPTAASLLNDDAVCILQLLFLELGKAKGITRQIYLCTDSIQILSARTRIVAYLFRSRISIASLFQKGCWMKKEKKRDDMLVLR